MLFSIICFVAIIHWPDLDWIRCLLCIIVCTVSTLSSSVCAVHHCVHGVIIVLFGAMALFFFLLSSLRFLLSIVLYTNSCTYSRLCTSSRGTNYCCCPLVSDNRPCMRCESLARCCCCPLRWYGVCGVCVVSLTRYLLCCVGATYICCCIARCSRTVCLSHALFDETNILRRSLSIAYALTYSRMMILNRFWILEWFLFWFLNVLSSNFESILRLVVPLFYMIWCVLRICLCKLSFQCSFVLFTLFLRISWKKRLFIFEIWSATALVIVYLLLFCTFIHRMPLMVLILNDNHMVIRFRMGTFRCTCTFYFSAPEG